MYPTLSDPEITLNEVREIFRRDLERQLVSTRKSKTTITRGATSEPKRAASTSQNGDSKSRHGLKFIDLFCGIGGFRIAFERTGSQCVFSSDYDKFAQMTYEANFGDRPYGDIRELDIAALPPFDILCAGFPCQPFSLAGVSKKNSLGRKHGFDDESQGNLFTYIAKILDYHRPAAFVLENVKHLYRHDNGRTFKVIHDTLAQQLGYDLHVALIDAQAVVPQRRERIFLVGFRSKRMFEFPAFPATGPKLSSILDSEVDPKYTLSDHLWTYLQKYAEKHQAAGNGFGFSVFTGDDVARTLSARYHKDGSEILISQGPSKNPRRLTPKECGRLMGFPPDFKILVSDTQAYRQFGNSVVMPVVERIAHTVVAALKGSDEGEPVFRLTPPEPYINTKPVSRLLPLTFEKTKK